MKEAFRHWATLVRSGIIGIALGVMPALGISTANIVAYMYEKKAASPQERETFGEGNVKGLLAPETAKSACVVGDLIPTFTLGVPGSAATAIFLAALVLHGITPGPEFFQQGVLPYTVFCGVLLAQFSFFFSGIFLARHFAKVIRIPNSLLAPGIVALCVLGAHTPKSDLDDVFVMLFFGVVGYILARRGYPVACIVLGPVLGRMLEGNYHRSLLIGDGNPAIFVTEPVSAVLFFCVLLSIGWPFLEMLWRRAHPPGPKAVEIPGAYSIDKNEDI